MSERAPGCEASPAKEVRSVASGVYGVRRHRLLRDRRKLGPA
jgi:hypothetical protein